jgi:hypothetical protein
VARHHVLERQEAQRKRLACDISDEEWQENKHTAEEGMSVVGSDTSDEEGLD